MVEDFDAFFRETAGKRENGSLSSAGERWIEHRCSAGKHSKVFGSLAGNLYDTLNHAGAVFYADDVTVIGEFQNLWSFKQNSGEYRNGIEQHGNRRGVGYGAIVSQVDFRIVRRFVVIRRFDQGHVEADFGGAFGACDGLGSGFGAGSGDEDLARSGGLFCGYE